MKASTFALDDKLILSVAKTFPKDKNAREASLNIGDVVAR